MSSQIITDVSDRITTLTSGFSVPLALVVVMETPLRDSLLSSVGSFTRGTRCNVDPWDSNADRDIE